MTYKRIIGGTNRNKRISSIFLTDHAYNIVIRSYFGSIRSPVTLALTGPYGLLIGYQCRLNAKGLSMYIIVKYL